MQSRIWNRDDNLNKAQEEIGMLTVWAGKLEERQVRLSAKIGFINSWAVQIEIENKLGFI